MRPCPERNAAPTGSDDAPRETDELDVESLEQARRLAVAFNRLTVTQREPVIKLFEALAEKCGSSGDDAT